ncbi:MAG TPA: hypothetical protein QGG47_15430 [Acidobacteriota bacterium]|nr:hypothetical protein [Acidobacteriota bacterium]
MERRGVRKLATFESIEYRRLLGIIRRVRNRWRLRVLLRGLAFVLVAALATILLASWGMDAFRYRPWAVVGLSGLTYSVLAYGLYRFLVRPLGRRVTDEQVALYVQEHTDVDAALVSAVEFGSPYLRHDNSDVSAQFAEKLVKEAVLRAPEIGFGKTVESGELRRMSGVLGAASMAVVAVALMNPAFLLDGARRLLTPFARSAAPVPYSIGVTPGDSEMARGGDQLITASLSGFDSDQVEISFKLGDGDWQRETMTADTATGAHQFMMFRLPDDAEYFVEASGIRSPLYRLEVVDVPYVERIDLELVFPEYSGLSPQTIEDGGDIAALAGTRVRLHVVPTVAVPGGSLRIEWLASDDDAKPLVETLPLEAGDDGLRGELEVVRSGYYRVELSDFGGALHEASSEYLIEALTDQPPIVAFDKPGRDVSVTSIEEVFTEVSAEDDYGLAGVDVIYSVNSGEQRTVSLLQGSGADRRTLTAGHTFYLEEEELEPGDFVVYFARAMDNRVVGEAQQTTTDLYFVEVQPFDRRYQQADAGGGGGGGGGQQGGLGMARRQREVVSATFKLARDADRLDDEQMVDDLEFLAGVENDLRDNVQQAQAEFGGVGNDEDTLRGIDYLAEASEALAEAAGELTGHDPDGALPPEQRALQHLMRFEALFLDLQVSMNQGGGGGGAAGDMSELEEMFEGQADELDNQYESVRRERQNETDNAVDEAMQRLTELARRQQQQIERQRAQGARAPNQGGGQAQQRQIAEQAEELARELERLGRRNSQRDLQEAANRLREAADAMRRAAASGGDASASDSARALNDLQNARRLLDQNREGRLDRDLRDAQQRIAEMREDQTAIERDVDSMSGAGRRTQERIDDLFERKDRLTDDIRGLERNLDDMARESRSEQMAASRALQEAAEWVRDEKLADKVRYSKGVVQERDSRTAEAFEQEISDDLASLEDLIDTAAGNVEQSPSERLADAVDDTRDLIRRLESFEDRLRDAAEEGQRGDSSGQSDPGEQGDPNGQGDPSGQGEAGSQNGQGERGAATDPGGGGRRNNMPGGSTSGVPGARQFAREFRERVADAEELLDRLGTDGLQTTDLDAVVGAMRDFEEQFQGTARGLDELSGDVIDGLKLFEFWLRRVSQAETGARPQLAGSDRVPEEYRSLVEEYFRALGQEDSPQR